MRDCLYKETGGKGGGRRNIEEGVSEKRKHQICLSQGESSSVVKKSALSKTKGACKPQDL